MKQNLKLSAESKSGNQVELSSIVNLTTALKLKRSCGKGFTLAEILITLTVIGVVAALTIPSLLQNTNDAEFKTAWKKSFADLNQAVKMAAADNGGSIADSCLGSDLLSPQNCFINLFKPHLNYIKACNSDESNGNCWFDTYDSRPKYLNNSGTLITYRYGVGFILNNGVIIDFWRENRVCNTTTARCGPIFIDVNGFKNPNVIGKDIFFVSIMDGNILPYGANGAPDPAITCVEGSTDPANSGAGCAAKYLYE